MKRLLTLNILLFLLLGCAKKPATATMEEGMKDINGTQLYYRAIGQGEPLLIVHGGPGLNHHYLYEHLLPLSDSYRLIFYDQRVSGSSSLETDSGAVTLIHFIEDIEGMRKAFGIERLNLLAHSWGGLLAMKYAALHPEQVKSLALVSPAAMSSAASADANAALAQQFTQEDQEKRAQLIATEAFQRRAPETIEALMKIGFRHQFHDTAYLDRLDLSLHENYARSSQLLQYLAKDIMDYDFHPELKAIKAPALILYGDHDPLTEPAGKPMQAAIPHAGFVVMKDCGHFPFIEKQEEFLEIVRGYLEKVAQ